MKIRITLKDPDGFSECVGEAVKNSLAGIDLSLREREAVIEAREEETWQSLERWVECQEYITIVFDTEAGTATVVKKS